MKSHPLSEVFPLMDKDELAKLAADIEANGLREPVVLYEGMILDGRNRWSACKRLKMQQVETVQYEGDNPAAFVVSVNLHRRHLSVSQRAMIAAELARLEKGWQNKGSASANAQNCALRETTQEEAAEALSVSKRTVQKAKKVLEKGSKKQVEKVKKGEATVDAVESEIREKEEQAKKTELSPTEVLANLADTFCTVINQYTKRIDGMQGEFNSLKADPLGHDIHWPTVASQLTAVRKALHQGRPKRPCPYCKATGKKGREDCKPCRATGHVCESIYRSGCAAVGAPAEKGDDE